MAQLNAQELVEAEALLTHIAQTQQLHLQQFASLHQTMMAIAEGYNVIASAVDPSCVVQFESPSFLPATPSLGDEIDRCAANGTLLSDEKLKEKLLRVEDTTQLMAVNDRQFGLLLPLLCLWMTQTAEPVLCAKGFTLLHEGVRLLGPTILPQRELRPTWREVVASLQNLCETPTLLKAAALDIALVMNVVAHVRAGAQV